MSAARISCRWMFSRRFSSMRGVAMCEPISRAAMSSSTQLPKVLARVPDRSPRRSPINSVTGRRSILLHRRPTQSRRPPITHFSNRGRVGEALYLMFLAGVPSQRYASETRSRIARRGCFRVRGQEIYLHLPDGVANSKLTNAYFDSKLADDRHQQETGEPSQAPRADGTGR